MEDENLTIRIENLKSQLIKICSDIVELEAEIGLNEESDKIIILNEMMTKNWKLVCELVFIKKQQEAQLFSKLHIPKKLTPVQSEEHKTAANKKRPLTPAQLEKIEKIKKERG